MQSPSTFSNRQATSLIAWGFVGVALNVGLARFTYGVMLPAIRQDLALGYFAGGSLNAIHLAGYLIGTLAAPAWSGRVGMRVLALQAHLLVVIGAVLCALAPASPETGILILGGGRLMTGLGAGAGIVAILVLVFTAVPATKRPVVSAVVWSGMGGAVVVSGLSVAWLLQPGVGWRSAFVLSAMVALAVALFPLTSHFPDAPRKADTAAASPFRLRDLTNPGWCFLVSAYLLFGVGYIAYSTFAGARLTAAGSSLVVVGATWTMFGLAAIVGAALTVPVLHAPRLKALALVGALVSGAAGALLAANAAAPAAVAAALLVGLGIASTPTIVSGYARERSTAEDYARAFSLASAALGIGQLVGPVAAGALSDRFGPIAAPLFAAGAYAAAVLLAGLDARVRKIGEPTRLQSQIDARQLENQPNTSSLAARQQCRDGGGSVRS